ncbi:MAG: transcriptional regulator NrdR [Candidatus Nanoarchaeia archaeon]|nr:transcriptional regulator NrdR [Candidatus Nanoarchaeia archaeon]
MKCIFCSGETHVTDKRESPEGTRRRRECLKCKKRFTTYEKAEKKAIIVVKKDGRREPFSREKIKIGIMKACEKRPIPLKNIENALDEIEEKLYKKGKEVKSEVIGKMIMHKLKKLDDIAYIRFASVYMNFKDIKDFKLALRQV